VNGVVVGPDRGFRRVHPVTTVTGGCMDH
jgi:hypothetical protein